MKSLFAIRLEDALIWQDVSNELAGIAERSGFHIRPKCGWNTWQVWATRDALTDLKTQMDGGESNGSH